MSTPAQQLDDFRPESLDDRHERQLLLLAATGQLGAPPFDVLDLGTGTGVTAVWAARKGWRVTAVDEWAESLAVLERQMQREPGLPIQLVLDDAVTCRSVPDGAFDIVYSKDLLEHVDDFQTCLDTTFAKLRPGGLAFFATTNVVCPIQMEYHGVGPYSWYPRWLKDRIRNYASTKRPAIVNHSPCPALHWFSRWRLARALRRAGFTRTWDLYDLVTTPAGLTRRTRLVYPLIRFAGRVRAARPIVDLLLVGLTMVAQKPALAAVTGTSLSRDSQRPAIHAQDMAG
jgi:2-polyprenyl-3-methyl-5-hydroxy-6-metoxy-1,4-benzoquinol methylase